MSSRYLSLLVMAAAVFAAAALPPDRLVAQDATSPQARIQERKAALKKMGRAMKTLVDALKTDAPDRAAMLAAAESISAAAAQLPQWFPAGTGAEAGVDTDALPYIWQNRAKFDSIAVQLAPESRNLVAALQAGDRAAISERTKALGAVCSSCHKSFRAG